MTTYLQLTSAEVTTRSAAVLTGVARSTAARTTKRSPVPEPVPGPGAAPVNKLSLAERTRVLEVVCCA